MDSSVLSSNARLVGHTLTYWMDNRTLIGRAGAAAIASGTALSLSSVRRALAELQDNGYLKCVERGFSSPDGGRVASRWQGLDPIHRDHGQSDTVFTIGLDRSQGDARPYSQGLPNSIKNSDRTRDGYRRCGGCGFVLLDTGQCADDCGFENPKGVVSDFYKDRQAGVV